jgi:hypothetical protein
MVYDHFVYLSVLIDFACFIWYTDCNVINVLADQQKSMFFHHCIVWLLPLRRGAPGHWPNQDGSHSE